VEKEKSVSPSGIRAPNCPVRSYAQYRLHSTYDIYLNFPVSWRRIITITGQLQLVSSTVSWCCKLLLQRQFAQAAVFIGIQME